MLYMYCFAITFLNINYVVLGLNQKCLIGRLVGLTAYVIEYDILSQISRGSMISLDGFDGWWWNVFSLMRAH